METDENVKIINKNTFYTFLSLFITTCISVISAPLYARNLSTDEYAVYGVFQSWYDILFPFLSLSVFAYASSTAMSKFKNERDSFIKSAQCLITLISVVTFCLFHRWIAAVTGYSVQVVGLMFCDIILMTAYYLWDTKDRYEFKYVGVNIVNVVVKVLVFALSLYFIVVMKKGGMGRIYGLFIVHLLFFLPIYIKNLLVPTKISLDFWKYIIKFCVPLLPHYLAVKVLNSSDRIMVEQMCGADKAGIYTFIYNIAFMMLLINDTLLKTIIPWTYERINTDKRDEIAPYATKMMILIAMANLIFALVAPDVIKILIPLEYHEGIDMISVLACTVFFMFLYNLFSNIEFYYGKTQSIAVASVMAAILNIVLNAVFIPMFGYKTAAYTTLIAYIVYALAHFINMRNVENKYCNNYQFYNDKQLFLGAVLLIVIMLVVSLLYANIMLRYAIAVVVVIIFIKIFYRDIYTLIHHILE